MRIAIASGKGGTGKTTVATSLAVALAAAGRDVTYVDCDVEEPNGHLFLQPEFEHSHAAEVVAPVSDPELCIGCGACVKACRSSAIVSLPGVLLTFPKLCSGCGGCVLACPAGALTEAPRPIGVVEQGWAGPAAARGARLRFVHGRLEVGEAKSPPLIRAVLDAAPSVGVQILDAPPGTSCPVVEAVQGADVVLLVTEPTPFGLNDLELAADLMVALDKPAAVLLNRAGLGGDPEIVALCRDRGLPIVARLPDDRHVAHGYCHGRLALDSRPELVAPLLELAAAAEALAGAKTVVPKGAPWGPQHGHGSAQTPIHSPDQARSPATPSERLEALGVEARELSSPGELVVISGKGGTGKTSIVGSFAALASDTLLVDCDVDAADLHLLLRPRPQASWAFSGGCRAVVDGEICSGCGTCAQLCRFGAMQPAPGPQPQTWVVDPVACEGCGVCVDHCPEQAVRLEPAPSGRWSLSDTALGWPLLHARLGAGEDNSGKLVAVLRQQARAQARLRQLKLEIVDGPPGIGCPVISSVTGADAVLLVTEPSVSGLHDLERVARLCDSLRVPAAVCVNKADLAPALTVRIREAAARLGLPVLGEVRYDPAVIQAQIEHQPVVVVSDGPAASDLRALWRRVRALVADPAEREAPASTETSPQQGVAP